MLVVNWENTLMVDIDETLITEIKDDDQQKSGVMVLQYGEIIRRYTPCSKNIALMKHCKKTRGYGIVVWSANGKQWAEKVVLSLGLQDYVDIIMTKPKEYLDDKPVQEWMPCQIYLGVE